MGCHKYVIFFGLKWPPHNFSAIRDSAIYLLCFLHFGQLFKIEIFLQTIARKKNKIAALYTDQVGRSQKSGHRMETHRNITVHGTASRTFGRS